MCAVTLNRQTLIVRPVTETDVDDIRRLLESAWRIHIRLTWRTLQTKIATMPGLLIEDQVGVRGFMLFEPQPLNAAIIVAAGLRDTWGVKPYLELLLPNIEQLAREEALTALIYIGYEAWLIEALQQYGFKAREWIVMYERFGSHVPPSAPQPAHLRIAHRDDLTTIRALDAMAFDHLWHKAAGHFNEALAVAGSFVVAEIEGQIVGYEWCEMHQKRGHLTRLATHPDFQGRGIGAQLLRRAILDALAKGVNFITLNTQETNYRSQSLYARFGFVQNGQRIPVLWKKLET